jgi:cytochrome c peroxidase
MRHVIWLLLAGQALGQTMVLDPPLGLDLYMPVPETNPLTREKIALGRRLFFDKRLSRDGSLACATCHDPGRAFADGRAVPQGVNAMPGARNSPALINRGYGRRFFWDGRAASLERQVIQPITSPIELGLTTAELERRTGLKVRQVTEALATYVRTIRSGDSPFDRYVAGQTSALTPLEQSGLALFRGRARCTACHVGPSFTDEQFHNTGVAWRNGQFSDEGRYLVTGVDLDRGAFKTPTLREIARTAPYMHDGSLVTLDAVVDFYSDGGRANPALDQDMRPGHFTDEDKRALVAFLRALSGRIYEGGQEQSRK